MTDTMTDQELIAALEAWAAGTDNMADGMMAKRVAGLMRAAAARLSELSPSRLSANDEGVTDAIKAIKALPRSVMETRDNNGDIFVSRARVLRILSALSTKPEAVKECATEGCEDAGTRYYEAGGVGSYYCRDCHRTITVRISTEAVKGDGSFVFGGDEVDAAIEAALAAEDEEMENAFAAAQENEMLAAITDQLPTPASGEQMEVVAFLDKVQEVLSRRFPFCRDCADNDGTCPSSGLPCDISAAFGQARAALADQGAQS